MKILILGATGVAGGSVLPRLLSAGHDVLAHARSASRAGQLLQLGARPVLGDSFDPACLREWMCGADAVIDLRVQVPDARRALLPWGWQRYARLRGAECGKVVDAAIATGVPRVVRDTVTMTYADGGDRWLDERQPTHAGGHLAANLTAEAHLARLTAAGGQGVAVRFGGFYGPSDEFSQETMAAARRGRSLALGDPAGYTSAVHTDDIGSALLVGLSAPGGVYNAVDDEPMTRAALSKLMAEAVGRAGLKAYPAWLAATASSPIRALTRSQRVSNRLLKSLGWQPTVPTRRTGWPQAFEAP